ncbi:iron chelate uptake ABC transporter family permease subunit [Parvibaculum sedimenti]|uniref:Iron chelate uptake ABC transporter family permease subunit n=1 Tax=Parvibaculum sedimenti TaxID=2608632 RepID=A0A6N6VQ44_9HYPH|nr:iron ABC transporter permease [Parvibaculum sedimenti]KAB7741194.1 iron chelate uptake ABC transporter family permease subunit [Parvibaculum sedimenti]
MRSRSYLLINLGLALLAAIFFVASIYIGRGGESLVGKLHAIDETDRSLAWLILKEVRLPRALLGLFVGATLGLTGAALQGLLRNPLAEPGLIGASSGAALGAVLVFYFGLAAGSAMFVPLGGVAGALISLGVLYMLSGRNPSIVTLILAGVAISAFTSALTSLALSLAASPYAVYEIIFWLLGSFTDRSMDQVRFAAPFMALGALLVASTARGLDALTLGEDTAATLGFNQEWLKARAVIGTGLAVGAAVSVTGVIGFVGLVVPHLVRPLVGHQPGRLLLPSTLAGAAMLLAADLLVRLPMNGPEPKLGVVTSLIGAPFFLWLILRTRREAP